MAVTADLGHECGEIDAQPLPIVLEGIAALVETDTRCAMQARTSGAGWDSLRSLQPAPSFGLVIPAQAGIQ